MGFFDALPVKVMRRSPPEFAATADYAQMMVRAGDQTPFPTQIAREAYFAAVLGVLALMSDEITGAWSATDVAEILRIARTAKGRLNDTQTREAEECIRFICDRWNLDWRAR